jgi:hypothetical protein
MPKQPAVQPTDHPKPIPTVPSIPPKNLIPVTGPGGPGSGVAVPGKKGP